MRILKFFFIAIALWKSAGSGFCIESNARLEQLAHRFWTMQEGLPNDSISSVLQAHDGYIWAGTQQGLVRFDGVNFTVFDHNTTPELHSDSIFSVIETRSGTLWIGTDGGGVTMLKNGRFQNFTHLNGLGNDIVFRIYEDHKGRIWFATLGSQDEIAVWDGLHFTRYQLPQNVSSVRIRNFVEDSDHRLWIGTTKGIFTIANGRVSPLLLAGLDAATGVRLLSRDGTGRILLVTTTGEAKEWDGSVLQTLHLQDLPKPADIQALLVDRAGGLWIGGRNILFRYARGESKPSVLADVDLGSVRIFAEDDEGGVWAAIENGVVGLHRFADQSFYPITRRDGLKTAQVWCLHQTRDGNIWAGTRAGLSAIRDDRVISMPASITAAVEIYSISGENSGDLWLGTAGKGALHIRGRRVQALTRRDGLPSDTVYAVFRDREGTLWLGTTSGLARYRDGRIDIVISEVPITVLRQVADGSIWAGSHGNGAYRIKDGEIRHLGPSDGLAANTVQDVLEDSNGDLWFGTTKGLTLCENNRYYSFTQRNGLSDENVKSILDDNNGNFWIGCQRGVYSVRKKDLKDLVHRGIDTITTLAYNDNDGLPSTDMSGGVQDPAIRTRDGRLWFATPRGIGVLRTNSLPRTVAAPRVLFEGLILNGKPLDHRKTIEIEPGRNSLELKFTGFSFHAPSLLRFRYQLEGFDREWIDAGYRRNAYYTDLPPGGYRVVVAAQSREGISSTESAVFQFTVRSFFYQETWFFVLLSGLIAAGAYGLYRWRMELERARFTLIIAERGRLAQDIHDTLLQGFTAVILRLEALARRESALPQAFRSGLEQALRQADRTIQEGRDIIWGLRQTAVQPGLVESIEQYIRSCSIAEDLAIGVTVTGQPLTVPSEVEIQLRLIAREAIQNAIRHSRATKITVELTFLPVEIRLQIRDNGIGFSYQPLIFLKGHWGLLGMRERAARIRAKLTITSAPGQGTTILVITRAK